MGSIAKTVQRHGAYWLPRVLCVCAVIIQIFRIPWQSNNFDWDAVKDSCSIVLRFLILESTPEAFIAVGVALVLSLAAVDLSSSGVLVLSGAVYAVLSAYIGPYGAAIAAILTGSVTGFFLGFLVSRDVNPLVTTWAVGTVSGIIGLIIASQVNSQSVQLIAISEQNKSYLFLLPKYLFLTLSASLLLLWLSQLPLKSRAIGANRQSARYAGIRIEDTVIKTYVVAGIFYAIASVIYCNMNNGASTTAYVGGELRAIAIAVLGGTAMSGGYISLTSVASAAFFWTSLRSLLTTSNLDWIVSTGNYPRAIEASFAALLLVVTLFLRKFAHRPTTTVTIEDQRSP